jgi:hypothetical protein
VAGRPKLQLPVYAYNGDPSWLGWNLISGRWYHGRGEVDASSVLLAATGQAVGDRITLTVNGKPVTVRIAGEVFDPSGLPTLFTSWQTLGGAAAGLAVGHYDIALKPGTSTQAYSGAMDQALGHGYVVFSPAGRLSPRRSTPLGSGCWRCWWPCSPRLACSTPCSWPRGNASKTWGCSRRSD